MVVMNGRMVKVKMPPLMGHVMFTVYHGQVFVADTWNNRIRLVDIKTGMVSTLAGSGRGEWKDGQGEDASFDRPKGVAMDPISGQVIVADMCNNRIRSIDMKSRMVSTLAGSGHREWERWSRQRCIFSLSKMCCNGLNIRSSDCC